MSSPGTRGPFPNQIGTDAYYENMGNSKYNGLELTFKRTVGPLSFLASYTYSKSYDQTSSIQEQVDPYHYHALDSISAFDLKHDFVVSYNYDLPVAHMWRANRLTSGWALSGITRFASGLPVTFAEFWRQLPCAGPEQWGQCDEYRHAKLRRYRLHTQPQSAQREALFQYHCFHTAECSRDARQLRNDACFTGPGIETTTIWLFTR